MNIEQDIYNYIVINLFRGEKPTGFNHDYNLIDDGVMDSLEIINLMTYLESEYNIEFDDMDITPENFSSVSAIVNFVNRRTQEK